MATIKLTNQKFIEDIFDYTAEKEWSYKDDVPAVIDFYADWCGPCKAVAPVLEELSETYGGKVKIYKCDTEAEKELSGVFGIRSIPSILFVPKNSEPQMAQGALPKHQFEQLISPEIVPPVPTAQHI